MEPISYSVREAARIIGLGKTKLYELIKAGRLPIVKIGDRTLVRRCDLEALLDCHLVA